MLLPPPLPMPLLLRVPARESMSVRRSFFASASPHRPKPRYLGERRRKRRSSSTEREEGGGGSEGSGAGAGVGAGGQGGGADGRRGEEAAHAATPTKAQGSHSSHAVEKKKAPSPSPLMLAAQDGRLSSAEAADASDEGMGGGRRGTGEGAGGGGGAGEGGGSDGEHIKASLSLCRTTPEAHEQAGRSRAKGSVTLGLGSSRVQELLDGHQPHSLCARQLHLSVSVHALGPSPNSTHVISRWKEKGSKEAEQSRRNSMQPCKPPVPMVTSLTWKHGAVQPRLLGRTPERQVGAPTFLSVPSPSSKGTETVPRTAVVTLTRSEMSRVQTLAEPSMQKSGMPNPRSTQLLTWTVSVWLERGGAADVTAIIDTTTAERTVEPAVMVAETRKAKQASSFFPVTLPASPTFHEVPYGT